MGLDTVELVMSVEEEFGIDIPPEAAEKITTVGDLRDFVVTSLERKSAGTGGVSGDSVLQQIQRIFEKDHGVGPERVVPAARILADLGLD